MSLDLVLWQLIRSAGLLSYLLLSASVVAGVAVKTRVLDGVVKRPWVYELHQALSVAALATITGHVVLVLANAHVRFSLREVLIPFASDWRPLPVALGVLAMYLVALLLISTRLRSRIGQKAWRSIHYSSFLAWVFALVHGIDAGSDSALGRCGCSTSQPPAQSSR
jgi:sulfoxide reductase heme-binding subunit YedZ